MRIGFDAKRLFNNFTGLGNYSRFIVQALLELKNEDELILYSPKTAAKDHPDIRHIVAAPHVEVVAPPPVYRWTGTTSLWRSFGIARTASASTLDIFHGLSQELPTGLPPQVKKVVTVHDLIFMRYPALYSRIDARIYTHKVANACRDADVVVAISQQTAQDVMAFLGTPESKIRVIYQGTHPQFNARMTPETVASVKRKWDLPNAYILTVGTIEPRKNMLSAVQALAKLPKQSRLPLVIVGRETAYKQTVAEAARSLAVSDELIFRHDVPFGDLPSLYQGALLFVYPSLFEGFGIPIIEALQSAVPVVTSTGSCFSEAGGTAALYADPASPDEIASCMLRVLQDKDLRGKMIDTGTAYAKRFSPTLIASQVRELYRELAPQQA